MVGTGLAGESVLSGFLVVNNKTRSGSLKRNRNFLGSLEAAHKINGKKGWGSSLGNSWELQETGWLDPGLGSKPQDAGGSRPSDGRATSVLPVSLGHLLYIQVKTPVCPSWEESLPPRTPPGRCPSPQVRRLLDAS